MKGSYFGFWNLSKEDEVGWAVSRGHETSQEDDWPLFGQLIKGTRLTYNCAHPRIIRKTRTKKGFDQFSRPFRTFPEDKKLGNFFFIC